MDEEKIVEALTRWLDDDSEHAAADFGARFSSDHPGYDMTEMAMGFYAGYVAASKQIEPAAPEPSCLLCTEHDTCQYQGPEVCGDFVRKINASERKPANIQNPCQDCRHSIGPRQDHICDNCDNDGLGMPSEWEPAQSAPSEKELSILEDFIHASDCGPVRKELARQSLAVLRAQIAEHTREHIELEKIELARSSKWPCP